MFNFTCDAVAEIMVKMFQIFLLQGFAGETTSFYRSEQVRRTVSVLVIYNGDQTAILYQIRVYSTYM